MGKFWVCDLVAGLRSRCTPRRSRSGDQAVSCSPRTVATKETMPKITRIALPKDQLQRLSAGERSLFRAAAVSPPGPQGRPRGPGARSRPKSPQGAGFMANEARDTAAQQQSGLLLLSTAR